MNTISKWDYRTIGIYLLIPVIWDIIREQWIEKYIVWWDVTFIIITLVFSLYTMPIILRVYSIEIDDIIVDSISKNKKIFSIIWITALTFEIVYIVVYIVIFLINNHIIQYVLN